MGNETADFLVIGAGLAGLSFARDAQAAGHSVHLVDKGRVVGGRAATRRWEDVRVDHGAQYFTARSERLQAWVAEAVAEGWLAPWCHGFPCWRDGAIIARAPGHERYAPLNGMSELAKRLSAGLSVTTGAQVTTLTRDADGIYTARAQDEQAFRGRSLILSLPPVQLLSLAQNLLSPEMAAEIAAVRFWPSWALLLRLEKDISGADWPAVEYIGHPVLSWVARDHTRRESGSSPVLVVHASGPWSETHLEDAPQTVEAALRGAVEEVFGPLSIQASLAHRWRYALPVQLHPSKSLWDAERRIGVCGDWCDGPRVEGAIESGWNLAERV